MRVVGNVLQFCSFLFFINFMQCDELVSTINLSLFKNKKKEYEKKK